MCQCSVIKGSFTYDFYFDFAVSASYNQKKNYSFRSTISASRCPGSRHNSSCREAAKRSRDGAVRHIYYSLRQHFLRLTLINYSFLSFFCSHTLSSTVYPSAFVLLSIMQNDDTRSHTDADTHTRTHRETSMSNE